jgi:preprotein translocase subunit SecE
MKLANRYGENDNKTLYKNSEDIALITFVVCLITTFVASCIYIGIDGFLSK